MSFSRIINLFLFSVIYLSTIQAQDDPGIRLNTPEAFDGYTLLAPSAANGVFLIDNCGRVVNEWESQFRPGMVSYLDNEGNLLRAKRVFGSVFNGGGIGGGIEKFDWEGKLIWNYNIANDVQHQHHDFEILPNGNLLVLAWDARTSDAALAAGRIPGLVPPNGLWPEKIVELKPIGPDSAEIVWEWYLWDHIIQDFDSNLENFGDVTANPGKMDINFFGGGDLPGNAQSDWIHANALDYNPALDQIMFSSRNMNELYIIDHSTTTEEAATSEGGKYGKGGDFLYRYGNPESYKMGDVTDRVFFNQHDTHWVESGLPGEGNIMLFNNGIGRPGANISSVDEFVPPIDQDGNYLMENGIFGPEELHWSYGLGVDDMEFFSQRISGVQRQPNGNSLICIGSQGTFVEVTEEKEIVWFYISPLRSGLPVEEGQPLTQNEVFRAYKYGPEFEGLKDKTLTPGDRLETLENPIACQTYSGPTSSRQVEILREELSVSNPVESDIFLFEPIEKEADYFIYDLSGMLRQQGRLNIGQQNISANLLAKGMYILHVQPKNENYFSSEKFIKL